MDRLQPAKADAGRVEDGAAIAFSTFTLDLRGGQLMCAGAAVPLRPKTWSVLLYLARRPGALVTREEILDAVWPDVAVTPDTLTKSIGELRVALGDDPKQPRFIATVHRRGFRFLDAPRSTAPAAAAVQARESAARPFVGRQDQLARLSECFARASRGERQVVFIAGAAGVGKTTLLEAFLGSLGSASGPRIGAGASIEQHGPSEAYMPVLEALARLAHGPDGERVLARLRATAPSWLAQMPWLTDDEAAGPRHALQAARPERMLRECVALLEALASDAPLVLALEDLHWSDPSTVDLLTRIGQRREPARLLIVATYRPAEVAVHEHPLASAVRALRGQRRCVEVALHELPAAAVRSYLEARFPGAALPPALVEVLHAHTDGNPLFLRAVVDHMLARGWILDTAPGWSFDAMPAQPDFGVPDDARDMVALQIASLGPADRRLLEAVAVAGRDCSTAMLAATLERPVEEVEASCEALARGERFLRPIADALAPRWAFTHELYRQAVYREIASGRRRRLHLRIGQTLEAELGDRAAELTPELAHHFEMGGDLGRALHYRALAARRAHQRAAPREASEHLGHALQLVERLADAGERRRRELELRVALAPVLNERFGPASDALQQNGERALALCEDAGDPSLRFEILYGLCHVYSMRGDAPRLDAASNGLTELARDLGSAEHRLVADSIHCRTDAHRGRFAASRRDAGALLATMRARTAPPKVAFGSDLLVGMLNHYAMSSWMLGEVEDARAAIRETVAAAHDAYPFTRAAAGTFAALISVFDRRAEEALRASDDTVALAEEHGFLHWTAMASSIRGWARVQLGQVGAGIAEILAALATYTEAGARVFTTYMYAFAAEGYLRAGELTAGLTAADDGLRIADTTLDRGYAPELWRLKAELLLAGDRLPEAETCLQRAIELARASEARMLELRAVVSLARLSLARGPAARARRMLAEATGGFAAEVDSSDLREARALLSSPIPARRAAPAASRRSP